MARNDVRIYDDNHPQGSSGHRVAGGATAILSGEPVMKTGGAATVALLTDGKPVVGTDLIVGIAASDSTQTASADGIVDVYPVLPGVTWVAKAKSAAAVDTQAEYNALVGKRLLFDLTSGVFTVDTAAGDVSTGGLVVEPMDITRHPGCVRFTIRQAASYAN